MQNRRVSIWVAIVVVIVLLSLIIVYMQGEDSLSAPSGVGLAEPTPTATPSVKVDLVTYENAEFNYKIGIPEDWTKVIKDGYDTFIHSPSATYVQVQTGNYSPTLLLMNETDIANEIMSAGYSFADFTWYNQCCYSLIYADASGNSPQTYVETTFFDRETVVRLVFAVKNEYAGKFTNELTAIIDSFVWEKNNPFPEGLALFYSTYGNYEFAYPATWTTATSSNTYLAQDPDTGSIMSISATESTATYEGYDKLDYTSYASQGRSNFVLQDYSADKNIIYAQSSYLADNTQMVLIQYLVASGAYEYALTFEIPQAAFSSQSEMVQNIIKTVRIF